MYPNFAEILKPWPVARSSTSDGKLQHSVSLRQFPADTSLETLKDCCVENPQSIIFNIHDALLPLGWEKAIAHVVVSWGEGSDHGLSYEELIKIAHDLGQFFQGQLLGHGGGHLRVCSAQVFGFPSEDLRESAVLTIGHSNFELGYNSIAHNDRRQWERPYMLRSREKTAPKSVEIVRPPVREPIVY